MKFLLLLPFYTLTGIRKKQSEISFIKNVKFDMMTDAINMIKIEVVI